MKNKVTQLLKGETGRYIFFGAMTTLVNYVVFLILSFLLGYNKILIVNTISFAAAVAFAYFTNKIFVFRSKDWKPKALLGEMLSFASARIFSYFVEQIGLYLSADVWHLERFRLLFADGIMMSKLFLSLVVIVLNWVFSKFVIFKTK